MFDTLSRSWSLTKESWRVLMQDKELMLFPIISAIMTVVAVALVCVPGYTMLGSMSKAELDTWLNVVAPVFLFLLYFVVYFVIIFCNTAMLHCASLRFRGGDPAFMDGIRAAMSNLGRIAAWAAIGGTLGVLLNMVEERLGFIGSIIRKIVGGAWAIVTFFAVPVTIFEQTGPIEAIKRSLDIMKKTWGESLGAYIGLSVVSQWLAVPGVLLFGVGIFLSISSGSFVIAAVCGGIAVLYWLALAVVFSSLTQIFRAALYEYAVNGSAPTAFSEGMIKDAFRRKEGNKFVTA